jgi:hypothetical protein
MARAPKAARLRSKRDDACHGDSLALVLILLLFGNLALAMLVSIATVAGRPASGSYHDAVLGFRSASAAAIAEISGRMK